MPSGALRPRAAEPIRVNSFPPAARDGCSRALARRLPPPAIAAVRHLIRRVLREVPAELVQASLFGSSARGEARPDSDVDVLLVFRRLAPDREPHATMAEEIADEVAHHTGVPVTVWSVSLADLERGARTPMLVDALEDSIPLWCSTRPLPPVAFTPADALRCTGSLLDRVAEGELELEYCLQRGRLADAAMRIRDDMVRMCTALELLRGRTRARRGEVPRRVLASENGALPAAARRALAWAATSYGRDGRDSEAAVPPPPDPIAAARAVGTLRRMVRNRRARLARAARRAEPRSGTRLAPPVSGTDR